MNEETEVKAPVTRLRRRLSVEQSEDGKSSPALGTPTKKRGGRKAAKPELDLIDENATEVDLKKTTKKTIAKEVAELESEKPVTPSRRSARIKSNTSIVSDTIQNVDSPRAKRAARRTSHVGSDTEMSLTPVKTRRTRKDSSSSIEKQVVVTPTLTKTQIPEVITEEPDNSTKSTKDGSKISDTESTTQTPIRKSPRLVQKKSRNSNSPTQDEGKNDSVESNNKLIHTTESDKKDVEPDMKSESHIDADIIKEKNNTNSDKNRLSVSSCNLIRNLEDKPKKKFSDNNKSMTEAQESNKIKTKRHRTKSWTTITNVSSINEDFYSDNEIIKKKHLQKLDDDIKKQTFNSGSGDNMHNNDSNDEELNCSQNKIMSSGKKKKKETISEKCVKESEVRNLFQKDPSENIQTTIVMEDSDSNPLQVNISKNINEDQCVPVVDHQFENKDNEPPEFTLSASFNKDKNNSKIISTNDTCEPMDVDETLPEYLPNLSTKLPENQEKSLLHNTLETNKSIINQTSNKSKRKSSTSLSMSQNLEKSNAENKSTLVLSQLKDLSNTENKTPKISKKEQLSQSSNLLNITQENKTRKKISLNYLTSTPLQQKVDLGDTCKNKSNNIFDNNISKNKGNISPKKNMSEIDDRSEQISEAGSESDEELETSKTSNLLDDEAEEASEDYESGDSQDEDEKQYEKDNEIIEKGETLTSEDDLSDDSDYEKDSFVVTSDEEDNELLSGSGDDLSMSDNELKMNPKSKKKYNDKKLKEQKQASREMYESRHKLNTSKKDHSSKSSKTGKKSHERLDSSNSDNSEDNIKFTKKNRRMRLDSTATDSINISKIENTDSRNKDMDNMSVSSNNENVLEEKEITMNEENTETTSDPLAPSIKKENISIKDQNISIDFVDTNVQKDNTSNTTTNSKSLESKNPLEGSDNESSSSLSTEDENIAQNYNNMLNDLKVKTANNSLNIEKKSKKKSSIPIVDHLNITQSKALKMKNKSLQKENTTPNLKNDQNTNSTENWSVTNFVNQEADQDSSENADTANNKNFKYGDCSLKLENKSQKKSIPSLVDQLNLTQGNKKSRKDKNEKTKSKKLDINEEQNKDDSSDSIDLKLLFSEDSINSSDLNKENFKKAEIDTDSFIPLKKAEAKTDIRATKDDTYNDDAEQPFFIDTIGNQPSNSSDDEEIVNKKNTHDKIREEKESSGDESNEEPLEISYKKEQNEEFVKKNKAKKENVDETDNGSAMPLADKSLLKAPQSEKKRKNSLSKNISQLEDISDKSLTINNKMKNTSVSFNVSSLDVLFSTENIIDSKNNKSNNKTPGSEKKKIKRLSEPKDSDVELNNSKVALNKSVSKTPQSEKKKKRLSLSENLTTFNLDDKPSDESLNKENSINESLAKTPGSGKKKPKTLSQIIDSDVKLNDTEPILNKSISKTPKSEKKKKKLSVSDNPECFNLVDKKPDESLNNQNKSINKTPGSGKKKIKNSSDSNGSDVELSTEVALNKSISKTPKSEKKKNISVSENSECINFVDKTSDESIAKTPSSGQKKIKKLSQSNGSNGELNSIEVDVNRSIGKTPNSEKKKKKQLVSKNSEASVLADKISDKSGNEPICETKKKFSSQFHQVESEIEAKQNITQGATDGTATNNGDITNAKKRRRSSSMNLHGASSGDDLSQTNAVENNLNVSNKKKRKISQKAEENDKKDVSNPEGNAEINITQNNKTHKTKNPDIQAKTSQKAVTNKKSKEIRDLTHRDLEKTSDANLRNEHKDDNKSGNLKPKGDKNNKRKNRDDDNDINEALKVRKENSFDHIHISRLPPSILNKLDDKPNKVKVAPEKKVISTTEFEVEETRKRRNKPSNYLEESIYINDDESIEEQKKKAIIKKPKVLPFVPTATTSNSGYTTKFQVNVIPNEIKFVAQSNNVNSYKNEYLYGTKIKRLGTYDLYKKNRNIKMSKF